MKRIIARHPLLAACTLALAAFAIFPACVASSRRRSIDADPQAPRGVPSASTGVLR